MNREIKFRAWNDKQMLEDIKLGEWLTDNGEPPNILDFEDMIIMQFTGLKDKNGNEIYEGDIIKADHCGVQQVVYGNPYNAAFCVGNMLLGVIDELDIEIIGNIHENPELITQNNTNA